MNLVPHIFRKDVRHFYPEILVYSALLIAFGIATPISWIPNYAPTFDRLAPALLPFLIPVVWLVMIARLVHDEALVGDRQFWMTRPYPWVALLVEKLLFLLVFLHLPLLFVQAYLLHRAHLAVGPAVGSLLQYQGFVGLFYVLPLVSLAVVTASFGRLILSVLAGLLYVIGVFVLTARLTQHSIALDFLNDVCGTLIFLTLAAVVLMMYARRPVRQARLTLVGLPLILLIITLSVPATLLVHHAYAASTNAAAFAFESGREQQQPGSGEPLPFDQDVLLQLPVSFQPSPNQPEIGLNGAQLTVRAADGFTWASSYQSAQNFTAHTGSEHVGIYMPASTYQRLGSGPVTVELHLAVQAYTLGQSTAFTVPASGTFAMPGHGLCHAVADGGSVQCRFPLRAAPPGISTFEVQDVACDSNGPRHSFTYRGSTYGGGLHFGFDPLVLHLIPLHEISVMQNRYRGVTKHFLCPGAQVVFTPRDQGPRYEVVLTQQAVQLPLYVVHKQSLSPEEEPEE